MNRCIVIGDPIEHSMSPVIHNAGYKALGLEDFSFEPARVASQQLQQWWLANARNFRGISVTMPHKAFAVNLCNEISPEADEIGVVNTIVNNNGVFFGTNTDWIGYKAPLDNMSALQGKKVVVLGAGGAGRAAIYAALNSGAERVMVLNRTRAKAEKVLRILSGAEIIDDFEQVFFADTIINTTSVGMGNLIGQSPLPDGFINKHQVVFESIYHPRTTALLEQAQAVGARTIDGLELLLFQAFAQFELYTGRLAPQKQMREALS
jgi:shikimate dehydrogenase